MRAFANAVNNDSSNGLLLWSIARRPAAANRRSIPPLCQVYRSTISTSLLNLPLTMATFTVHTDCLFDPKQRTFVDDVSITIDTVTGLITEVVHRKEALASKIEKPDIDLRGKVVCPGFVDAHTHIFLHAYA